RRLLVGFGKQDCFSQQNGYAKAATPTGGIGSVAKLGIIDVVGAVTADILLRDEIRRAQQLAVGRVRRRKEFADQRQGALPAAPRLGAAGGVAADRQRLTALLEIPGIRRLF